MFDTGITEVPVDERHLVAVNEEWLLHDHDDAAEMQSLVGSAVSRCLDLDAIRTDGAFDLTVDVMRRGHRLAVKVDVTRAVRRFDMDGSC